MCLPQGPSGDLSIRLVDKANEEQGLSRTLNRQNIDIEDDVVVIAVDPSASNMNRLRSAEDFGNGRSKTGSQLIRHHGQQIIRLVAGRQPHIAVYAPVA